MENIKFNEENLIEKDLEKLDEIFAQVQDVKIPENLAFDAKEIMRIAEMEKTAEKRKMKATRSFSLRKWAAVAAVFIAVIGVYGIQNVSVKKSAEPVGPLGMVSPGGYTENVSVDNSANEASPMEDGQKQPEQAPVLGLVSPTTGETENPDSDNKADLGEIYTSEGAEELFEEAMNDPEFAESFNSAGLESYEISGYTVIDENTYKFAVLSDTLEYFVWTKK